MMSLRYDAEGHDMFCHGDIALAWKDVKAVKIIDGNTEDKVIEVEFWFGGQDRFRQRFNTAAQVNNYLKPLKLVYTPNSVE